ncbi:MAG TPA: tripartite tricarboxylate transporter substrate binding protein [Alphaproteobacteria bacterium]|nr:tripartite tricarboxylate transporter substrate binding protein [Alphaproteobacteria bacterium]
MASKLFPDMTRRTFVRGAASMAAAGSIPGIAFAQEKFPSKTIEVVTHAGVGGGTDITARMMMVQAPAELGTELVVVNRTGGSGAAALAYAASRPRDGHTILLITQTHLLTILRSKNPPVQYEDIVALARATEDPQILMVGAKSPYKTAKEFLEASKSRVLKYGTTQVGGVDHIAVLGFARQAGLQKPTIVPFRGGGDIVINLVGGNVDAALLNHAEAESQLKAGEVRGLLTVYPQRVSSLPDTPTAAELGIQANYSTVRGFVALRGTPEDRLKILEEGLVKAMRGKIYQSYLESSGQAAASVVGRAEWQAQLDAFHREGRDALAALGTQQQ